MSATLQQIDNLKKEAAKLQPAKPELEKIFWDKFRLEFNYNSNHMEGNTLTYGHTQLLLLFDKVGSDDYSLRELEEMKAHDAAMKMVIDAALNPSFELTEKFIREINEIILVRPFYKEAITPDGQPTRRLIEPGKYKKQPNSVRLENGEIFNYASPEETPAQMGDLIEWFRTESQKQELHPVQIAALFHYRLVRIHPFDDSNGRTSRLMMNYVLLKNGYAPNVIKSNNKKDYLNALNRADTGDIDAFVNYIIEIQLQWQELYTKAIKGEKIEEPDDFEKEVALLKQRILEKDDTLEVQFRNAPLEDIFRISILPLLSSIAQTLSKLDDFYFEKKIQILFSGVKVPLIWEDVNVSTFSAILDSIRNQLVSGAVINFYYIHQIIRKASSKDFSHASNLKIIFHQLEYEIYISDKEPLSIKKYYHRNLSTEEIELVSKLLAKSDLQALKEEIEK